MLTHLVYSTPIASHNTGEQQMETVHTATPYSKDLAQRLCRALDERDALVRMLEKATHALSLYNDKLPMLAELNAAIEKVRGDK